MLYTDETGETHELPKYDVAMARRFAKARTEVGEARYRAEYDAVRASLGLEAADALLDGKAFESVDLTRLEAVFQGVASAYDAPANEAQRKGIADALSALDGEQLDKLTRVMDAVNAIDSAQRRGFRLVR